MKTASKMKIAYGAKPPSQKVNGRHCLQELFCAMCKSIDRFLGQEKEKKATTKTLQETTRILA